jgi:hypothetical protein
MVKYINPLPVQADINAEIQYLDLAWIGASYRTGEGFAGIVGLDLSNTINVGYSYDYTASRLIRSAKELTRDRCRILNWVTNTETGVQKMCGNLFIG